MPEPIDGINALGGTYTFTGNPVPFPRSIGAASGSFVLTGKPATLTRSFVALAASRGSFVLTGNATALTSQRKITAAVGTFTLTGRAALFQANRKIVSASGAFTLTGQNAGLTAQRKIVSASGSFTLGGQAAILARCLRLAVGGTAFTFTGQSAGLLRTNLKIVSASGSFTLGGQAAGLTGQRKIVSAGTSFTLTGSTANLGSNRSLIASSGAFTLSSAATGLIASRKIVQSVGTFTLTGQAAGLGSNRSLVAGQGSFAITGQPATLTKTYISLVASGAAFTLTGQAAGLTGQRKIVSAVGSFTLTGQPVTLGNARALIAASTAFVVNSPATGLTAQRKLAHAVGTFTLTGPANRLARAYTFTSSVGTFTLTGQAAGLSRSRTLASQYGAFYVDPINAGLTLQHKLVQSAGSFSETGYAANLLRNAFLQADSGSFTARTIFFTHTLSPEPGEFTFRIWSVSFRPHRLDAESGIYSLTGRSASRPYYMYAVDGFITAIGNDANLNVALKFALSSGTFALTGQASSGSKQNKLLSVSNASFTLTGYATRSAFTLTASSGTFSTASSGDLGPTLRYFAADGATFLTGSADAGFTPTPPPHWFGPGLNCNCGSCCELRPLWVLLCDIVNDSGGSANCSTLDQKLINFGMPTYDSEDVSYIYYENTVAITDYIYNPSQWQKTIGGSLVSVTMTNQRARLSLRIPKSSQCQVTYTFEILADVTIAGCGTTADYVIMKTDAHASVLSLLGESERTVLTIRGTVYPGCSFPKYPCNSVSTSGRAIISTTPYIGCVPCLGNDCEGYLPSSPYYSKQINGVYYTLSGVPDSYTWTVTYIDNWDNAVLGTETFTWSGFGLYNHGGYVPFNERFCEWERTVVYLGKLRFRTQQTLNYSFTKWSGSSAVSSWGPGSIDGYYERNLYRETGNIGYYSRVGYLFMNILESYPFNYPTVPCSYAYMFSYNCGGFGYRTTRAGGNPVQLSYRTESSASCSQLWSNSPLLNSGEQSATWGFGAYCHIAPAPKNYHTPTSSLACVTPGQITGYYDIGPQT